MFLKADDLVLLYLPKKKKKMFFIWGVAYAGLLVVQIGPEKAIFRGFTFFFFSQNYWIATEAR